jgi:protein-tyrosine phosphatase
MSGCVDANQILPGLWLGSIHSVKHYRSLIDAGITHVITVMAHDEVVERNIEIPDGIGWTIISVEDNSVNHLYDHLDSALSMIEAVVQGGGRILVHCIGGISRSPTVVTAYIMWKLGLRLTAALAYVRERRPCIEPNWTFYGDLQQFETALYRQMEMGDVPNKTR